MRILCELALMAVLVSFPVLHYRILHKQKQTMRGLRKMAR